MKILVVEDENALREVIVRSLEKERYDRERFLLPGSFSKNK